MKRKTDIEMRRRAVTKTARTLIRLEASLEADRRINDTIPDLVEEFDASVARGELPDVEANLNSLIES